MSVRLYTIFSANSTPLFISLYVKNVNKFVSFSTLEHTESREKIPLIYISVKLYKK